MFGIEYNICITGTTNYWDCLLNSMIGCCAV